MRLLSLVVFVCLSVATVMGQSCEVDGNVHSTFEDVQLILSDNDCTSCHNSGEKAGGWHFETYDAFTQKGLCDQPMIVFGNASQSYFYTRMTGGEGLCGESNEAHKLADDQIDQIESWINLGAPEFCMPLYSDIREMMSTTGCIDCHSESSQSWSYQTYESMIGTGNDDNCGDLVNVLKGNAVESLLFDKVNNDESIQCGEAMNGTGGPLSYDQIASIRDWINGGAPETAATLPVVLSRFELENNKNSIELSWTTEVEVATDKFVIQRSSSGRNFENIDEISATGSSTFSNDYQFTDEAPLFGDNYYRLKILDLDGSYDYSNIRLIRLEVGQSELSVSPNPAMSQDRLTVRWYPEIEQERTYLNIVDVNGQRLARKIIFEGTNYVRLPRMIEGVYYVIVEDYFGGFLLERIVIIN